MLIRDQRTKWCDKFIKKKYFHLGDWALFNDNMFKNFKGKLSTRWLRPYAVDKVYDNGLVKKKIVYVVQSSFVVNRHRLKVYHTPLSKEYFVKHVLQSYEMQLISKGSYPPIDPPL